MSDEGVHTIIFWVKASAASQAYLKMLEAIESIGDDLMMSAVAPRLCKLDLDLIVGSPLPDEET